MGGQRWEVGSQCMQLCNVYTSKRGVGGGGGGRGEVGSQCMQLCNMYISKTGVGRWGGGGGGAEGGSRVTMHATL